MAFMDQAGFVKPVRLNPDGSVPVDTGDDTGAGIPSLLAELIWEVRELRRVQCEATDQFFTEYPADGG